MTMMDTYELRTRLYAGLFSNLTLFGMLLVVIGMDQTGWNV